MNLTKTVQLLDDLNADFKIYSRKNIVDSKDDDIMLIVNHEDDTSTVIFYDMNCNYIKTL